MIKRRAILFVALIATSVVLIPAFRATAQEFRGRIIGTVVDNTGAVLPGVTVNTTSPALIQPQTTVTEADGTYMLQALPSGVYLVTFELAGFETSKVENVRVLANTTLTVNTTLQVAGLAEAITVTGAAPTVDTSSTRMGTNFTKELLTEIPNARDVWAAMAQAPGITVTGYDVGGSHTGTQTGYMTYGFSGQNSTRIEGLNTAEGSDANMGYFDFGSFEEFQITASGNLGDQDTPGAQLNVITKSGGDNFSGTFYQDWESLKFIGNNVPDSLKVAGGTVEGGYFARTALKRGNPIDHQYDTNGMLGGRIIRGKLWFFGSYRRQPQFKIVLGAPELLLSKLTNYTTKFTYQLNSNNQFIFFYNRRTKLQDKRNLSSSYPFSATSYQTSTYYPYKVEWLGTLSSRMLLDVITGWLYNNFPMRPQPSFTLTPGQSNTFLPGRYDQTAGVYLEGGPDSYYQNYFRHKPQIFVTLSYTQPGWHGSHDFKFGYERRHEDYEPFQDQPYNIFYMDRNGLYNPDQVRLYNTPVDPITLVYMNSVYAQDSWRFNKNLTINAALRMDRYADGWSEISVSPEGPIILDTEGRALAGADVAGIMAAVSAVNPLFYQNRTTPAVWLTKTTDFGPRIGMAYDPSGNGRTSIKAFWGRFFFNSADRFTPNAIPVGEAEMYFKFNDLNGNKVLDGPQELGAFQRTVGGGGTMTVDPKLERAYGNEISAHFEQEIIPGLSGRVSFIRKTFGDRWNEVDLARINAFTVPVAVADPGVPTEGIAASTITVYDIPKGTAENRVFMNTPEDEPIYNTIEVAINRRFKDKWMLMGSFGNTWTKDFFGQTSATSSTGTAGNGAGSWNWLPIYRRFGMEKTTLYNAKVVGQYVLPFEIALSGSYKLQQGRNWGRSLAVSLPNYGSDTIRVEPVTQRRAPATGILDFRLGKKFTLYRNLRAEAMVDIFNILNAAPVMTFRSTTGARFKEISALLDPRIARFGFRIDF